MNRPRPARIPAEDTLEGRGSRTMKRRETLAILGQLPLAAGIVLAADEKPANTTTTPPFWKSRLSDVEEAVKQVTKGQARVLARSPGNRPVHLVTYGEPL